MPDDKDATIATTWGDENPQDLSTGAEGSAGSATDTGGLDANGNELGAARPGSGEGRSESQRMDEGAEGARKP